MPRLLPWLIALTGAALLVGVVWFAPIDVPRTIEAPGRVLPAQEWQLTRDAAGRLTALHRDHRTGAVVSFLTTEIERGDALEFTLADHVGTRTHLAAGDTVGRLASSEHRQRLSRLAGELATSEALLQQTLAGEKAPVIEEAEQELLQAREQLALQERVAERQRQLAREQLLAAEQLEQTETQLRLYRLAVSAAEARLDALRTGARPADVALARARVQALQAELRALEDRLARSILTTPIGGTLVFSSTPDTLLSVVDASSPLVAVPLAWDVASAVAPGQPVLVDGADDGRLGEGRVVAVHPQLHDVNGRSYRLAIAELDLTAPLPPGLRVHCRLPLPALPLRTVAGRFVSALFRN